METYGGHAEKMDVRAMEGEKNGDGIVVALWSVS